MDVEKNDHSKILSNNSTKAHFQETSYNKVWLNNFRKIIDDQTRLNRFGYESDQEDDVRNPSHNLLPESILTSNYVYNNKEIIGVSLYFIIIEFYIGICY